MHVYWVESFDHGEDWFVAADSIDSAIKLFADDMGYDAINDEVCATEICPIPDRLKIEYPDFLSSEEIKSCGGEFIDFHDEDLLEHVPEDFLKMVAGQTRIVRFGKDVYMEGNVMRVALQMQGKLNQS